jgi:predicted site-specific integrase-resolvase
MLPPETAATISGITLRTLFRWIESGHIHFVETPEGSLFVCLESLMAHAVASLQER